MSANPDRHTKQACTQTGLPRLRALKNPLPLELKSLSHDLYCNGGVWPLKTSQSHNSVILIQHGEGRVYTTYYVADMSE